MRISVIFVFLVIPSFVFSQQSAIVFTQASTLEQLQAIAQKENKYIFLDCYTTWCGPCKMMESQVYSNDSVARFYNAHFISMKLQMDTSKRDDSATKSTYQIAHAIRNLYNVNAFPTYLFLSPQGTLVHRGMGFKPVPSFTALGEEANDPSSQYYTLLDEFNTGKIPMDKLPQLARTASGLGDKKIALKLGKTYVADYLLHLPDALLYSKNNILFIYQYTKKSSDPGFRLLYDSSKRINRLLNDSIFSQRKTDYVISTEQVDPVLIACSKDSTEPDWERLTAQITNKYDAHSAERVTDAAKMRWYKFRQNWSAFTTFTVAFVRRNKHKLSADNLNEYAWDLFLHTTDLSALSYAVTWMAEVIKNEKDSIVALPADLDTYANLLYKTGKVSEALRQERKALDLAMQAKIENYTKEFRQHLELMQSNKPTWIEE